MQHPSNAKEEMLLARVHPCDTNLRSLSVELRESIRASLNADKTPIYINAIRVEFWGLHLDAEKRTLGSHLLNGLTVSMERRKEVQYAVAD